MTLQATEALTLEIDHPIHEDWWEVNSKPLDSQHRIENEKRLQDRFSWTEQDPQAVWGAVETGVWRTNAYRLTHEVDNRSRLANKPELTQMAMAAPETPYVPPTLQKYNELAGKNATLPQYVSWFGNAALTAFGFTETYARFDSISLELAGVGQAGDWESTRLLDDIIEGLPDRLRAADSRLKVVTFQAEQARQYSFIPAWDCDSDGGYNYQFAMIRRRRPVADVIVPNVSDRVRIFKQSVGLVVLGQLPDADLTTFQQAYAAHTSPVSAQRTAFDEAAAAAGGAAFERAIKERGDATEVVPISVQYIMKARRPVKGKRKIISL